MNDIEYIEIMTTNYARYKIFRDNILEFNCNISEKPVDCSTFSDFGELDIMLVDNLLLVIDNTDKIECFEEEFDVEDFYVCGINIWYKNGENKNAYVNLTTEDYNENQLNYVANGRLYVTIDEEI